jgi:hypothetical protein
MRSVRPSLVVLSLGAALSGCGGAALGSGAAAPGTPEPLTELDVLQRDFDESEARLAVQLEGGQGDSTALQPREAEGAAPSAAAPLPKAEAQPRDDGPASNGAPPQDAPAPACDLLCRALSSMRRSADGLCSLTSEQHDRCTGARERLAVAVRRVTAAGCSCR